jgi:hypothetical protein
MALVRTKPSTATSEILNALIAASDDAIWATELALLSGGRRVDFWTLVPAASRGFRATAYEIKVSRSDYKRDNDEKQSGALKFSDRFWYVTPPGLLRKDELPSYAGLQEWDGKQFSIVRKAPMRSKAEPDWEFIVSILRNSGECRRDVGLFKAQIAFFEHQNEQRRTQDAHRNQMSMRKWLRRA